MNNCFRGQFSARSREKLPHFKNTTEHSLNTHLGQRTRLYHLTFNYRIVKRCLLFKNQSDLPFILTQVRTFLAFFYLKEKGDYHHTIGRVRTWLVQHFTEFGYRKKTDEAKPQLILNSSCLGRANILFISEKSCKEISVENMSKLKIAASSLEFYASTMHSVTLCSWGTWGKAEAD